MIRAHRGSDDARTPYRRRRYAQVSARRLVRGTADVQGSVGFRPGYYGSNRSLKARPPRVSHMVSLRGTNRRHSWSNQPPFSAGPLPLWRLVFPGAGLVCFLVN